MTKVGGSSASEASLTKRKQELAHKQKVYDSYKTGEDYKTKGDPEKTPWYEYELFEGPVIGKVKVWQTKKSIKTNDYARWRPLILKDLLNLKLPQGPEPEYHREAYTAVKVQTRKRRRKDEGKDPDGDTTEEDDGEFNVTRTTTRAIIPENPPKRQRVSASLQTKPELGTVELLAGETKAMVGEIGKNA